MSSPHPTPRATLLSTTFWEILPSHHDKIINRWSKIAHLHHEAKSDILATDRAGAVASIKAELEMLEQDVEQYRKLVNSIDITDIAGTYVVGGKAPHRALEIAKEDKEDLEESLEMIEEKVKEVRADVRYGFEEEESARKDMRNMFKTTAAKFSTMGDAHNPQDRQLRDLTSMLIDLEDRADRVLTSLYLLKQLDEEFAAIESVTKQQDCVDLIRSHTEKMEANLEVMERKSELLDDERICDWINNGRGDTEKENRNEFLNRLIKKMDGLQKQMAEVRRGYVG
ncbi:uncharacterized protein J4E87_006772 [Alternaria ethzedia]|uniref:uncharacterized protein n=1 Tax=Alternaria ethzedia TaxID=181014 RepID=UPI0020C4B1F8|nr:uncharacterized protein J4E87_006772 [Alternaria ethzedia]KAI4621144.1 hypothetical protein J4E87_006772 [Alternaria ethzedia]